LDVSQTLYFAADLFDALDPNLPEQEREAAITTAVAKSPRLALHFMASMLMDSHEFLEEIAGRPRGDIISTFRKQFGLLLTEQDEDRDA
jgi:hypothetical protein